MTKTKVYYTLPPEWADRIESNGVIFMTEEGYQRHKKAGTLPTLENMIHVVVWEDEQTGELQGPDESDRSIHEAILGEELPNLRGHDDERTVVSEREHIQSMMVLALRSVRAAVAELEEAERYATKGDPLAAVGTAVVAEPLLEDALTFIRVRRLR